MRRQYTSSQEIIEDSDTFKSVIYLTQIKNILLPIAANVFKTTEENILGKSRKQADVIARNVLYIWGHLALVVPKQTSANTLAKELGRDHATFIRVITNFHNNDKTILFGLSKLVNAVLEEYKASY